MLKWTPVTPFVECPHCHKLLEMGSTNCPECREPISEEYAGLSAVTNIINTQACRLAKDIRDRDRIMAMIVVVESIASYVIDARVFGYLVLFWFTLVPTVSQLFATMLWYFRFSRFAPLGDADYIRAKGHVKQSALVWMTILVFQIVVIAAMSS